MQELTEANEADSLVGEARRVVGRTHGVTGDHLQTLRESVDRFTRTITVEEVVNVEGGR